MYNLSKNKIDKSNGSSLSVILKKRTPSKTHANKQLTHSKNCLLKTKTEVKQVVRKKINKNLK